MPLISTGSTYPVLALWASCQFGTSHHSASNDAISHWHKVSYICINYHWPFATTQVDISLGIAGWAAQLAGNPQCKVLSEASATWIVIEESQKPFAALMNRCFRIFLFQEVKLFVINPENNQFWQHLSHFSLFTQLSKLWINRYSFSFILLRNEKEILVYITHENALNYWKESESKCCCVNTTVIFLSPIQ